MTGNGKQKLHRAVKMHGFGWGLSRILGSLLMGTVIVLGAGIGYERLVVHWDNHHHPPPGEILPVNGHRLHIHCQGQGTPTVVFEAAPGEWSLHWRAVQKQVAVFTRACAYDRAGYGWSDPGPLPRSAEQIALELANLLDRANVRGGVVIAAHGPASFAARQFAARYPETAVGLVLVDALPITQVATYRAIIHPDRKRFERILPGARFGLARAVNIPNGLTAPPDGDTWRRQVLRADFFESYLSETEDLAVDAAVANATPLQEGLPLVVLYQNQGGIPGILPSPEALSDWAREQRNLADLTGPGVAVPVDSGGKHLPLDNPKAVTDAIRAAVQMARRH